MDEGQLAWTKTWLMKYWLLFWWVAGTKLLKKHTVFPEIWQIPRLGSFPWQNNKFGSSAQNSAGRWQLLSLIITIYPWWYQTLSVVVRAGVVSCRKTLSIWGTIWGKYSLKSVPRAPTICSSSRIIVFCSALFTVQYSCIITAIYTRSTAIRRGSTHLTWLYCMVQIAFQYETCIGMDHECDTQTVYIRLVAPKCQVRHAAKVA